MKRMAAWSACFPVLANPLAAAAQQNAPYYHQHMWDGGWHGWIVGPIFMVLLLAVVVAAAVLLVRGPARAHDLPAHRVPPARSPLDILKERFARGEIDKAEFEERRRVLDE
jgi:putative membrane protein